MDKVFKALGDETRRRMLDRLLRGDGQTLAGYCNEFREASRQAVSKHLGVLERANLVTVKWQGKKKVYFLNSNTIHGPWRWLDKYEKAWVEKVLRK